MQKPECEDSIVVSNAKTYRKFKISSDTVNFPFSVAHSLRSQGSPTLSIAGPIEEDMALVKSRVAPLGLGQSPHKIFG